MKEDQDIYCDGEHRGRIAKENQAVSIRLIFPEVIYGGP